MKGAERGRGRAPCTVQVSFNEGEGEVGGWGDGEGESSRYAEPEAEGVRFVWRTMMGELAGPHRMNRQLEDKLCIHGDLDVLTYKSSAVPLGHAFLFGEGL